MSEELKQAISALQCAKRGHCDHAMADEAIAALERALTQRPAAQTEREAPYGYCPECGAPGVTRERRPDGDDKCSNGHRYPSRSAHASLPTQPAAQEMPDAVEHYGTVDDLPAAQATPEPVGEAFGYFRALPFGWEQCGEHDDGAVALYDRPAPGVPEEALAVAEHIRAKAATPEPVGEALQFPPMPEGWPARFRCDSCDGNGEIGELVSSGHFQPPERQTCPDCGGRGWTSEEHAFNADHMREFAEAHALLTHTAPGVPEDVQRDAERLDWLTFNISGKALRDIGVMWGEHANARAAIDAAMLAAAQAKGGGSDGLRARRHRHADH